MASVEEQNSQVQHELQRQVEQHKLEIAQLKKRLEEQDSIIETQRVSLLRWQIAVTCLAFVSVALLFFSAALLKVLSLRFFLVLHQKVFSTTDFFVADCNVFHSEICCACSNICPCILVAFRLVVDPFQPAPLPRLFLLPSSGISSPFCMFHPIQSRQRSPCWCFCSFFDSQLSSSPTGDISVP